MNCSNNKCNKEIISSFTCNKCLKNFCQNKCLTEHLRLNHNIIHPRIPLRTQHSNKNFIPKGKLLIDFTEEPLYNFKNFEFCRTKENKIKSVGSGSFGDVYLATNLKNQTKYAIKHIRKARLKAAGQNLDIIYREISLHRLFMHENIIRFYGHNEDEENFFMILEYANGGNLFGLIRRHGCFEEKEAFKYFIQSAYAVCFLHENGFAHRDLKPENLLITDGDKVKLCDFGWCVDASSNNRETFCGTYEYMAPEMVQEIPYGKAIDVWSLGILLYELIHGHSPFRAENQKGEESYQEIFKNIIKHEYTIEKDISKDCADLIGKMLTPDHKTRIELKDILNHPWVTELESNINMRDHYMDESIENSFKKAQSRKIEIPVKDDIITSNIRMRSQDNRAKANNSMKEVNAFKIPDTNFSLFEANVFEDTLKIIDTKKKRKLKNDLDYNEIRLCNRPKLSQQVTLSKLKDKNEFMLLNMEDSSSKLTKQSSKTDIIKNNSNTKESVDQTKKVTLKKNVPKKINEDIKKNNNSNHEDTPTPFEGSIAPNKEKKEDNLSAELLNAIDIFEKAQHLHENSGGNRNKKQDKKPEEETFWDKMFAPFKCGTNNNS